MTPIIDLAAYRAARRMGVTRELLELAAAQAAFDEAQRLERLGRELVKAAMREVADGS